MRGWVVYRGKTEAYLFSGVISFFGFNNVVKVSSSNFFVLKKEDKAKVKKFVYAASSACYGEADVHPTPETAEVKLQHPYGLSKHRGEMATTHWHQCFGLPAASIVMFDVTGERADSTVMKIFLDQKKSGKPIRINFFNE